MVSESVACPKQRAAAFALARQVQLAEVVQDDVSDAALVDRVRHGDVDAYATWSTVINRRRFDWPRWSPAIPPRPKTSRRTRSSRPTTRWIAFAQTLASARGCCASWSTKPTTLGRQPSDGRRCTRSTRRTSQSSRADVRRRRASSPTSNAPHCCWHSKSCARTTAPCSPTATSST